MSPLSQTILCCVASVVLGSSQDGGVETPDLADSARVTSQLKPEGTAAAASIGVGGHLVWRVTIDDPERDGVALTEPALGPEWAVIDGPTDLLDPSQPKEERPDLDRTWTIMPLAGGVLATPALTATFADGAVAQVPAASVEVVPSLGETEDVPRPLLGFREAPDRRVGDPRAALLVLGGVLIALVGLLVWRSAAKRRASARPASPAEPSAMDQIAGLEKSELPASARMAALAPLFRRAFDVALAPAERQRRAALTDEAWAREVENGHPDAASLLVELSAYRYGGGEPTSFAVKDAIERATRLAKAPSATADQPEEAA
ncbi:hypothetical protein Poly30_40630 [Planctomycetes bacterium Poly30]|uniref:Uncharacterized protein n=1 Tax=Saltatorellus ferox TaxID=2528018 RepID=A0A518EWQ2_9BACT|nr:hypothetical protein Poly30_40630 [Planctomycetes bacterium Poly30]